MLIRGRAAVDADTNIGQVLPYLIAREVMLALSIGFRFLFYLGFVSLPPQGEPPTPPQQDQPANFLRMDNEAHSGHWMRWGFIGFILKHALLAAIIGITVLQMLWRLIARFSVFGKIYKADSIMEVAVSGLLILKLLGNAYISSMRPRWKIVLNYLPIIFSLFFSLAVGIGDIAQCWY